MSSTLTYKQILIVLIVSAVCVPLTYVAFFNFKSPLLTLTYWHEPNRVIENDQATSEYYLQSIAGRESELWLFGDDSSPIIDRIRLFNEVFTSYRTTTLLKIISVPTNDTASIEAAYTVPYKFGDNYFKELRAINLTSHLTTFFLRWIENKNNLTSTAKARNNRNFPITRIFRWTGVKQCPWKDNAQHFKFDDPFSQTREQYSRDVRINMSDIVNNQPGMIDFNYLLRYSRQVDDSSPKYAYFIHVAKSATVTPEGNVYVKHIKIQSNGCNYDDSGVKVFQSYDEIYSIAMWAAHSIYHWMIDSISRMAVMLEFLRKNVSIRIHLKVRNKQIDEIFKALGIDPDRIITGHAFGKIVYVPRATNCYETSPLDLQIMSVEYRKFIGQTMNETSHNSIVYIRRTKEHRRFADNVQIEKITKDLSEKYGLKFELFADDNLPSVNETLRMFYRARVIVAGHGAGLLNMQYSRPGTIVIEANDYLANCPCFLIMAHVLGHKYHAIPATGGNTILTVDIADFAKSVEFHIKYAAEHGSLFGQEEI